MIDIVTASCRVAKLEAYAEVMRIIAKHSETVEAKQISMLNAVAEEIMQRVRVIKAEVDKT